MLPSPLLPPPRKLCSSACLLLRCRCNQCGAIGRLCSFYGLTRGVRARMQEARRVLEEEVSSGVSVEGAVREACSSKLVRYSMSDPILKILDESGLGLQMPERLFVLTLACQCIGKVEVIIGIVRL